LRNVGVFSFPTTRTGDCAGFCRASVLFQLEMLIDEVQLVDRERLERRPATLQGIGRRPGCEVKRYGALRGRRSARRIGAGYGGSSIGCSRRRGVPAAQRAVLKPCGITANYGRGQAPQIGALLWRRNAPGSTLLAVMAPHGSGANAVPAAVARARRLIVFITALPVLAQQVTSPRFEAQFTAREVQWRNEMLPVIEVQQSTHVDAEASTGV
jgi:hypothetical protein